MNIIRTLKTAGLSCLILSGTSLMLHSAEFAQPKHRSLNANEIAVTKPGNYDKAGTTYVLTSDISSETSPIFLGNNVTLDLNGYTITYAAADYQHLPNFRFDDGLKNWDVKNAPKSTVKNTEYTNPMIGENSLFLEAGEEIVSEYINLPVANRSYYAMVAASQEGKYFGIYVEDEKGNDIKCSFDFSNNKRESCPETKRGPKLGGGIVFAHIHGLAAGKYRVRVKALEHTVVIGAIDLRPAMDVGISIVDKTLPWAYYKCILDGDGCAFFDYTKKGSTSEPVESIARAQGEGVIHIKNGTIRAGAQSIRSWGIQSTAEKIAVHMDNLTFEASGSNALGAEIPFGSLTNSTIKMDNPFIIDRHRRAASSVCFFSNKAASEVSGCEFIGGQGCLQVSGEKSLVHDNIFRNNQTVTNHYSISCDGDGSKIYNNKILPIRGSGIYIFRQKYVEIFNNIFEITAAPPNNEYANTDYSTNAIRISDYGANKGDTRGWCEGNRVYDNTISITSQDYPKALDSYMAMSYGVFTSVGGGQNYVYNNTITVNNLNPNSKHSDSMAFFIGGSREGGVYSGNTITSNACPVWIGTTYGIGEKTTLSHNAFIASKGSPAFAPFKLGHYKYPTQDVQLISNTFDGMKFDVIIGDYTTNNVSAYSLGWTLHVKADFNTEIIITNDTTKAEIIQKTDEHGTLSVPLTEYTAVGKTKTDISQYTIAVKGKEDATRKSITMNKDVEIQF